MRAVGSLIRLVVAILLAITILPLCGAWLMDVWRALYWPPPDGAFLLVGLLLGAALVWWRRPNWLIHTFIHESCHALACWLTGVRVRSFQATDGSGGAVIHDKVDPLRSTIIALAPYTLPLLLAPVLILRGFVFRQPGPGRSTLTLLAGFLLVHHLHGLWHNVRLNFWGRQADLAKAGRPLSAVVISGLLCLIGVWWLWTLWR